MKKLILLLFLAALAVCGEDRHAALTIAHITDVHVSRKDQTENIRKIIDEVNQDPAVDLVVVSGDWMNNAYPEEFALAGELYQKISKPKITVPGNHETQWGYDGGTRFSKTFGADRSSISVKGIPVIGLNTSPALQQISSMVSSVDLRFLGDKLKEAKGAPFAVIVSHYGNNPKELCNWFDIPCELRKQGFRKALILSGHWHRFCVCNWGGYPGIAGRAVNTNKKSNRGPGYVIIRIAEDDTVTASEKLIGQKPLPPAYTFKLGSSEIYKLETSPQNLRLPRYHYSLPSGTLAAVDTNEILYGGAAFGDARIFHTTSSGMLCARDAAGQTLPPLWQTKAGTPLYGTPAVWKNVVISGRDAVTGFDAATGKELWRLPALSPLLNPGVVRDGILYVGLGKQDFAAVDAVTGKILWRTTCGTGEFQAPPAVDDDLIVTGALDQCAYALDRKTGKKLWVWKSPREGIRFSPGNSCPALGKEVVLIGCENGTYVLDRKTGKTRFSAPGRHSCGISADGKTGYCRNRKGYLCAFDLTEKKYKEIFRMQTDKAGDVTPMPVRVWDKKLFFGCRSTLFVLDGESGKVLTKKNCGFSTVYGIDRASDGTVWITLTEGRILKFPFEIK